MEESLHHHGTTMGGRDPHEPNRAATPLELLFDLTFVIAFGASANELAHAFAEGHIATGVIGFAFATFAVSWAWINFAWFASAYDTDDWIFRLTTMVQMVGVLILALGLPALFESLQEGDHLDTRVMVIGYVVMRVAMVFQWLRASRQDPGRSHVCRTYVATIVVGQLLWVAWMLAELPIATAFAVAAVPLLIELSGPVIAERRGGGTPWHPHHIAERHGLVIIIALGEGLIGTMASLSATAGPDGSGWSVDVAVLGVSGTALTFGMWWVYFVVRSGDVLAARPDRAFGWGYGHMVLFGATVGVGAGLHAAAYFIDGHSELTATGTVLCVAVPLAVYVVGVFALYAQLTRTFDPFHLWLLLGSAVFLVGAVLLAPVGLGLATAVLTLTPWVTVVGYEVLGHQHQSEVVASL
ncbi:MAG TPA: low temperature requirement protein A [Nocardioides sp.]